MWRHVNVFYRSPACVCARGFEGVFFFSLLTLVVTGLHFSAETFRAAYEFVDGAINRSR